MSRDGSWGRYHGDHVAWLEQQLASWHGLPFALTCCSGTVAVELALRGLKIQPGDEVLLAGYDFSGNFRCIEALGAVPVLVDIDPENWSLAADRVEQAIGRATRAIVVSHLHGGRADMRTLTDVAARHDLQIVEDACQVPGAVVQGRPAGTWGDAGVLSFGGSKLLTAGRGGAVITKRADVHQRIKIQCERGNHAFPLSELQAAVLSPQVAKLPERNEIRRQRVGQLLAGLADLPGLHPVAQPSPGDQASYYKVAFRYESAHWSGWPRDQFLAAMQAEGVAIDVGFRGFLRRSRRRCRVGGELHHAQRAVDETVLLHHPVLLSDASIIEQIVAAFRKVAEHTVNGGSVG